MKKTTLLIATLALSASVFAGQHLYLGGGFGYSNQDMPTSNDYKKYIAASANNSETQQNYTGRGFIGYTYDINQYYATGAEIAFNQFGDTSYSASNNSTSSDLNFTRYEYDILWVNAFHITHGLEAYAKLGGTVASLNASPEGELGSYITGGDKTVVRFLPKAGVGLGYTFANHWTVAVNYYHTFGSDLDFKNLVNSRGNMGNFNIPSSDSVLISGSYRFNFS